MGKLFSFSFLLQALVVIIAVLAFSYFDPFDLLVSNKLTLRDTPAQVQQIKSIGELISAEYYGEVISSYSHTVKANKDTAIEQMKRDVMLVHKQFYRGLLSIIDSDPDDKSDIKKRIQSLKDSLEPFNYGKAYLDVFESNIGKGKMAQQIKNFLDDSKQTNFFQYLSINKVSITYYNEVFAKETESIKKIFNSSKIKNTQLILVGRGKVQAGFKFDSLTTRNIKVDTIRNRIILIGLKPQILSCDINPWFIPELGLKGFEIIEFNKNADNIKILKQVKRNCLDSLRYRAIRSEILVKAKENAEQNLKNLFSLLLNNKDIEVKILTDTTAGIPIKL